MSSKGQAPPHAAPRRAPTRLVLEQGQPQLRMWRCAGDPTQQSRRETEARTWLLWTASLEKHCKFFLLSVLSPCGVSGTLRGGRGQHGPQADTAWHLHVCAQPGSHSESGWGCWELQNQLISLPSSPWQVSHN